MRLFDGILDAGKSLNHVEQRPAVSLREVEEEGAGLRGQRQRLVMLFVALRDLAESLLGERLEGDDPHAGEKRVVEGEGGVFGGRADQGDRPVLDEGEEGVLLRFVEAVDLVDKEDRARLQQRELFLLFDHSFQVGDAVEHGAKGDQIGIERFRIEARQRGLAASGRPPEEKRGGAAGRDAARYQTFWAQDMVLPDDLAQRFGPELFCKGEISHLYGSASSGACGIDR